VLILILSYFLLTEYVLAENIPLLDDDYEENLEENKG
jgi:hypothetical protein